MSSPRAGQMTVRIPSFVTDLSTDRQAALALLASCVALAAAGLDPHVLDPGGHRVQSALAQDASLDNVVAMGALVQAGFVLFGGAVADIWRSRRLLQAALIGLVIASLGATIMPDGPGLVASRVLAWASDGLIIPFAVGIVAMAYRGGERATALGILFAVYGATTALAPALVSVFGATGPEVQAFALCAAVAVVGMWTTHRFMPDLPGALISQRLLIVTTALWAFGVVALVTGLLEQEPSVIVIGAAIILVALLARRIARRPPEEGVHARAGGAALAAGLVVGFVQAVPMLVMPAFFTVVQGIDGLIATLLIAPFAIALFVAGPVAGWLLQRYSPRVLIVGGVWAITIADLVFYLVMTPSASYLWFIVPFILVGGGFVIATAIRTAVIFASTPARLPATAAALNEASIGVGARLGVTLVVLLRAGHLGAGTELHWLQLSLAVAVAVGLVGGVAILLLLGGQDPVRSVWDLRDERQQSG
jgi:DHA2 family methylenomycin A resistance protein-like MFS transporter